MSYAESAALVQDSICYCRHDSHSYGVRPSFSSRSHSFSKLGVSGYVFSGIFLQRADVHRRNHLLHRGVLLQALKRNRLALHIFRHSKSGGLFRAAYLWLFQSCNRLGEILYQPFSNGNESFLGLFVNVQLYLGQTIAALGTGYAFESFVPQSNGSASKYPCLSIAQYALESGSEPQ